jgi:hypothetical protein
MLRGEASNTKILVFDLTPLGLEPTIYISPDEHAIHYTNDAVHMTLK